MTRLALPEALRLGLERQRQDGAAIVHIVAAAADIAVDREARLLLTGSGDVFGNLYAPINKAAIQAARDALAARRSRVYSVSPNLEGGTIAGMQGGDVDIFVEVLPPTPILLIVGAGHIAQPLAAIGRLMDFSVTVIDDRPEFANETRFPDVDSIVVDDFARALSQVMITADTYAVLVTRGHVHDRHSLEHMLTTPARYIGMIGSRTRIRTVMLGLRQKGFSAAQIDRVYAPIGLDIAAETPAEIAVAIVAEIIAVRRDGCARHLTLGDRRDG